MTARLSDRFGNLKREGRAALVAYVMASDPDHEICAEILRGLPGAGADVIELGFPFSDPMADGPSIQKAAQRALKAGGSLKRTLELVRGFRAHDKDTPLILMGYANPIEQMGYEAFARGMGDAGGDGAIVVDLPPEEDAPLRTAFAKHDLAVIRLATPTTDDKRLTKVLEGASGFLYYVSVAGVTGANAADTDVARAAVERLKRRTDLPIAVGFGVREPEAARAIAQTADAVVVGSAFVDEISAAAPQEAVERVLRKVRLLSEAVRLARNTRDEGKRA
ncbi:MAG TPA: tryptophan synthase subunit alpha [Candidatus Binatia bacterium]|nr:tryptophan synthase subunit alpha [Candidatus Binatia bacterium]